MANDWHTGGLFGTGIHAYADGEIPVWDASLGRYVPGAAGGTAWADTPFAAGDYAANSSTWTVASGDVTANRSLKLNNVLIWTIAIAATSTIGAGNSILTIELPDGYTTSAAAGAFVTKPGYVYENGAVQQDFVAQVQDATHISIHRGGGVLNAGGFALYVTIVMEVDP